MAAVSAVCVGQKERDLDEWDLGSPDDPIWCCWPLSEHSLGLATSIVQMLPPVYPHWGLLGCMYVWVWEPGHLLKYSVCVFFFICRSVAIWAHMLSLRTVTADSWGWILSLINSLLQYCIVADACRGALKKQFVQKKKYSCRYLISTSPKTACLVSEVLFKEYGGVQSSFIDLCVHFF